MGRRRFVLMLLHERMYLLIKVSSLYVIMLIYGDFLEEKNICDGYLSFLHDFFIMYFYFFRTFAKYKYE